MSISGPSNVQLLAQIPLRSIILWPVTFSGYSMDQVDNWISSQTRIFGRLQLPSLHYEDLRNFLIDVYEGEEFVGGPDNSYRFSNDKARACWREGSQSQVLLVRASDDTLLELKDSVRRLCHVGRHAMHTTDVDDETRRVWRAASVLSGGSNSVETRGRIQ